MGYAILVVLGIVIGVPALTAAYAGFGTMWYQRHYLPQRRAEERARHVQRLRAFVRLVRRYGNNIAKLPTKMVDEIEELARVHELRVNKKDNGELDLSVVD